MSAEAEPTVTYRVADQVATITLSRPDKGNAYTWQMSEELVAALDQADTDDEVRVVVLTGSGRHFCVGMDITVFGDLGAGTERATVDGWTRDGGGIAELRLLSLLKPVIVAFNGAAAGIGATVTLGADVRIAAEGVRFAFPFTRRSIGPEACSTWVLPRIVGISQALEWVLTGRTFGTDEALRGGLISRVVPADELMGTAYAIAQEIVQNTSPMAVAVSRQILWRGLGFDSPWAAHREESEALVRMIAGPDGREGAQAFLEKRPPRFPSKVSADFPSEWTRWPERPAGLGD